jgi:hypothetical protein
MDTKTISEEEEEDTITPAATHTRPKQVSKKGPRPKHVSKKGKHQERAKKTDQDGKQNTRMTQRRMKDERRKSERNKNEETLRLKNRK